MYQIALQELNQWLFTDAFYDVAEVTLSALDIPIDISSDALEKHPLYRLWESELLVAKAKQKVSNSKYLPTLSAQYGFQKIGDQTGYNSYQLGIQVPLIFSKVRGQSKASKIDIAIVEQENKVKELRLKNSFKIALAQHNQLKVSWKYYKEEALPLAIEQRNVAALAYKEGSMDYIAFIQTIKNAIELEISTWQVLQKYAESKINLSYFLTTKS
jgi:cobalt-zinc-cadmium resistance protein CzcA